jgi:ribosomal protein S21
MAKVVPMKDPVTGEMESGDALIKRFKRACLKDDILKECKKRQYFMNKAEKRLYKSIEARKRMKRAQRNNKNKNFR